MKNQYLIVGGVIVLFTLGAFALQSNTAPATPTPSSDVSGTSGNVTQTPTPTPKPKPKPTPTPTPTPPPKPTLSCAQQVQAAQDSTIGKVCAQSATQMACPGTSPYIYTARNACEASYLAQHSWVVVDTAPQGY